MNLNYEKIVIGGSLEAFTYAFKNNLPVLYTNASPPFLFDYLQPDADLSLLNITSPSVLKSASGTLTFGPPKLQVWQKLMFLLSMSGKILFGDMIKSVRLEEDQLLINCGNSRKKIINFDQLIIFDDKGLSGLPLIKKRTKYKNIVYDWVNIVSGGSHEYDILNYSDDFINTVHFYPSDRNDNTKLKDLVSVSYLTDEQLEDFSYSDTYAKFKLLDLFKELGIRGARNGRDVKRPGKYKYYAVKLEPASRQVVGRVINEYEKDDRFIFNYQEFSEIWQETTALEGYLGRFSEII
tara:strand:+ start:1173 stop:2054 length:882 start_codon:yes stop_codon:yes gene_type:complete